MLRFPPSSLVRIFVGYEHVGKRKGFEGLRSTAVDVVNDLPP